MFATNLERSTLLNNAHIIWIMDFRTLCLTAFSLQHLVQILVLKFLSIISFRFLALTFNKIYLYSVCERISLVINFIYQLQATKNS